MVKKINAFTLVEVMLSMIIISILACATLPVITKTKPRIEVKTVRGQYACWINNSGNHCSQYYNERTPLGPESCNPNSCRFNLDSRPAHFYVIGTGAGSSEFPAETITDYTQTLSNNLEITLGKANSNRDTIIKGQNSSIPEYTIIGGADTSEYNSNDDLLPVSVEQCRLLSAGEQCEDSAGTQINCYIGKDSKSDRTDYFVAINCEKDGTTETKTMKYEDLRATNFHQNFLSLNDVPTSSMEQLSAPTNAHYVKGPYRMNFAYSNGKESVGQKAANSSYGKPDHYLNFENNANNGYFGGINEWVRQSDGTITEEVIQTSKMTRILNEVSVYRKSDLTNKIRKLGAGNPSQNGAVMILW